MSIPAIHTAPLPPAFISLMQRQLGEDEAARLFAALEGEPPTSIRLNPRKSVDVATLAARFQTQAEPVTWCKDGYYLKQRPPFTLDPLLHAGCYYVQEAASMAIAEAIATIQSEQGGERPMRVLDLCAAPGGKSTLWASRLPEGSLLVCNEPVRSRANILAENLAKWGTTDAIVTNGYAQDFSRLAGFFDAVAADVPCSGEGMFRKDDGARVEWTRENVSMCSSRARDIVYNVWPCLRAGGYLLFSTCTFNAEEDEDNVAWICRELGAEAVAVRFFEDMESDMYHFYPHRSRGEGFFFALLRKDGDAAAAAPSASRRQGRGGKEKKVSVPKEAEGLLKYLLRPEDFSLYTPEGTLFYAQRKTLAEDFASVRALFPAGKILMQGVLLAEQKGRKFVPQQPLALSLALAPDAFPRVSLGLDDALTYLRREALTLPTDALRGYVLLTFDGFPLGFANNLGARANNLYPAEWRIRKQG